MRKTTAFAGLGLAAALVLSGCATATEAEAPMEAADETVMIDTVNSDGSALLRPSSPRCSPTTCTSRPRRSTRPLPTAETSPPPTCRPLSPCSTRTRSRLPPSWARPTPTPSSRSSDSWRSHIPFFVNYTLGKATGDEAAAEQAVADLNGYAVSFGQLINSVVPELPAEAVQGELEMHAVSLLAAIDANLAGDPAYFSLLKEAAGHMPMTATALAGGIAANLGIQ